MNDSSQQLAGKPNHASDQAVGFQIIRASEGYEVVLVVTPPNVSPWEDGPGKSALRAPEGARFYLHDEYRQTETDSFFLETSFNNALCYFSGLSDGLGYGEYPRDSFRSLEEVEQWAREQQGPIEN